MAAAGVSAVVGAYASAICLATTQTAAPRAAPCGRRGRGRPDRRARAEEHLSLRAGLSQPERAIQDLAALNQAAGKAGAHGHDRARGLAVRRGHGGAAAKSPPGHGFEVKEVIKHPNPTRDFNNIVLRMRSVNPDIVIPANYYNEYALLLRAMKQQKVQPKAIYSVLGGAASSYKFLKEYPDVAHGIIDCNHWFNPGRARAAEGAGGAEGRLLQLRSVHDLHQHVPAGGRAGTGEIGRPRRDHRGAGGQRVLRPSDALRPTRFVDGQNTGARPLLTQVLGGDIQVIIPPEYRQADAQFPVKA